VFKGPLLKKSV